MKPLWAAVRARYIFSEIDDRNHPHAPLLAATQEHGVVLRTGLDYRVWNPMESTSTYKLVRPGDFVISLRSFQGGIEIVRDEGLVSPAYTTLRPLVPDTGFYRWLLKSIPFIGDLASRSTGIRQGKTIRADQFLSMRLPAPPPSTQRAIAAFLDRETARIDALVSAKRVLSERLGEKTSAIICEATTVGLDRSVSLKDSEVTAVGAMPTHWDVVPLMRLVPDSRPIRYGIVLPGPNVDNGVPIIKSGDVKPGALNPEHLDRTSHEIESTHPRSRVFPGDIVYSIRGSVGGVEVVPSTLPHSNLTQDTARVAARDGIDPEWLLFVLRGPQTFGQLEARMRGAAVRGINIENLRRVKIPLPPIEEQHAIATDLKRRTGILDKVSRCLADQLPLLAEYRQALITAAVTGQLDEATLNGQLPISESIAMEASA